MLEPLCENDDSPNPSFNGGLIQMNSMHSNESFEERLNRGGLLRQVSNDQILFQDHTTTA